MGHRHILPGEPPIEVELRQSARARRMTLRVAARDGRVTLTVPRGMRVSDALAFAEEKRGWLGRHLAKVEPLRPLQIGDEVPIEGRAHRVTVGAGRAARTEDGALSVPARAAEAPGQAVKAFLKVLARDRLVAASDHYSSLLGRPYARITLRDTRSRWGSCSTTGSLNYSWRLAMAPADVLAYVAAHEVAHLDQMNHSAPFWAVVASL